MWVQEFPDSCLSNPLSFHSQILYPIIHNPASQKSGQSCYWVLAGTGRVTGESMFPKKIIAALLEVCYSFSITMPYLPCTISQLANRPTSGQAALLLWLVSWLGFCEPLFPTHVSQTRHGSREREYLFGIKFFSCPIMKAHQTFS